MCSYCMSCLTGHLPSLYLVSVVFGTAIPSSRYIFKEMFFKLLVVGDSTNIILHEQGDACFRWGICSGEVSAHVQ